ncbi:MAG: GH92 family glycosyl hydrolase [Candidatus Azobacteroides sp.]|nr:GH92 family glycosyl hydrolase [Candidatus Azobacteroides sp.]
MKRAIYLFYLIGLLCLENACQTGSETELQNWTRYVDPFIGTGGHGHVFMGANRPFGLVQLGPTSILQTWDWTSGYHISDTTVIGFSHTHLSGTGIGDLSDISLMPATQEVILNRGIPGNPPSGLGSYFSHASEKAKPGYYAVYLERYQVQVELTATQRVGFHKYTFPPTSDACVILDLENGTCWDQPVEGYIAQENDSVVSGYRFSSGWADDQRIYFTALFSKPLKKFKVSKANERMEKTSLKAQKVYGLAYFDTKDQEEIYVKVALSPVSIENAKNNMQAELPGWDFEQTTREAENAWNKELNKIQIKTPDEEVKRIFYTGLYHTMVAPSVFCDVNGDYRGADKKIHSGDGFINYTTLSLWDTYRAAHPLTTIIHPEKVNDLINTLLHIYLQQGKLPVWHLMGCETDCMVGNPAISVVADAILKGFDGFDWKLAYEAMKTSSLLDERGLKYLKKYGYIPYDKEEEGLSKCMEYAIADGCLAQIAQKLNQPEDYRYFLNRSRSYRHYFDSSTGFVRGLSSTGKFRVPFNPFESVHRDNDYTEGNAWQYTWLAPHDVAGLIDLFGSQERFIEKLDSLFIAEGNLGQQASPDISGLIGQYAHGNEPSHHIIYLYPYAGQAEKSARRVREVLSRLYSAQPDGLSGNEDVGQMSAWYILSALGFYQLEPAGGKYVFGSPLVDEAFIQVGNGKTFRIVAHHNSSQNIYIQNVRLNGQNYDKYYISFQDIAKGGTLEFWMSDKLPSAESQYRPVW